MEPSIYSFSLYTALPLMLFFGFYFLFAKTPEKKIFKNYLRSRQIMGIAMLLLSANYSVHFFFGIRFKNADSAILMNMSTYFLCYSLFSSALIMLLDRLHYQTACVDTYHFMDYILNSFRSCVVPVAKRNHAKNLFICFSCMVSRFWNRFSSQSHNCIS